MGLETLVAAIDFIESQCSHVDAERNLLGYHHTLPSNYSRPPAQAVNSPHLSSSRMTNPPSGTSVSPAAVTSLKPKNENQQQNDFCEMFETRNRKAFERTESANVNPGNPPLSSAVTDKRVLHNALERCRRSDLRARLDVLRKTLPAASRFGIPCKKMMTTAATLQRAVCYIKDLKKEETEVENELKRLSDLKERMEQQIVDMVMAVKPETVFKCPCPAGGVLSIEKKLMPCPAESVLHTEEDLLILRKVRMDDTPKMSDCMPLGVAMMPIEEAVEKRNQLSSSVSSVVAGSSLPPPPKAFIADAIIATPLNAKDTNNNGSNLYQFVTKCYNTPASFDFYGGSSVKVVVIPASNYNFNPGQH